MTGLAADSYILDLDKKLWCILIDISDSICPTWGVEANLAKGCVAIETEVHRITTIWASAKWIRDHVCATRLTILYSWFCKNIKFQIVNKLKQIK